jgi:hypothetical protein
MGIAVNIVYQRLTSLDLTIDFNFRCGTFKILNSRFHRKSYISVYYRIFIEQHGWIGSIASGLGTFQHKIVFKHSIGDIEYDLRPNRRRRICNGRRSECRHMVCAHLSGRQIEPARKRIRS